MFLDEDHPGMFLEEDHPGMTTIVPKDGSLVRADGTPT
jgi:hypothetical protein